MLCHWNLNLCTACIGILCSFGCLLPGGFSLSLHLSKEMRLWSALCGQYSNLMWRPLRLCIFFWTAFVIIIRQSYSSLLVTCPEKNFGSGMWTPLQIATRHLTRRISAGTTSVTNISMVKSKGRLPYTAASSVGSTIAQQHFSLWCEMVAGIRSSAIQQVQ